MKYEIFGFFGMVGVAAMLLATPEAQHQREALRTVMSSLLPN